MKECDNESDNSFDYIINTNSKNSIFNKKDDIISPFNSGKKENNNINMRNFSNSNINNIPNNIRFFNNDEIFDNNINTFDDYQFRRLNLTDQQKQYLQAKDCSIIDKIFDFFFNW